MLRQCPALHMHNRVFFDRLGVFMTTPSRRHGPRRARPTPGRPGGRTPGAACLHSPCGPRGALSEPKKHRIFPSPPPPCRNGPHEDPLRALWAQEISSKKEKETKRFSAYARNAPSARSHDIMRSNDPPTSRHPRMGSRAASNMVPDTKSNSHSLA